MAKAGKTSSVKPDIIDLTAAEIFEIPEASQEMMPAVLTAEERGKSEVARFDVNKRVIAKWKKDFAGLKINGVEDKEGHDKVLKAWRAVRAKRLEVANKHKEVKADFLTITRMIDGAKNDYTALLEEIEDPLKLELDRIEAEKLFIKETAARQAEELLQVRVTELIENGIAFNGSFYAIGDVISLDVVTLKGMPEEDYQRVLDRVKSENAAIIQAKEEKQRLEQEEKRKFDEERLEQQKKANELQQRQEEMERKEKEMLDRRTKLRAKELEALGMTYNFNSAVWQFGTIAGGRTVTPAHTVNNLEDEHWQNNLVDLEGIIAEMKRKQVVADEIEAEKKAAFDKKVKEESELQALVSQRSKELISLFKMIFTGGQWFRKFKYNSIFPLMVENDFLKQACATDWQETISSLNTLLESAEAMERNQDKIEEAKKEAERKMALNDVQRFSEFLEGLNHALGQPLNIEDCKIKAIFSDFLIETDVLISRTIRMLKEI